MNTEDKRDQRNGDLVTRIARELRISIHALMDLGVKYEWTPMIHEMVGHATPSLRLQSVSKACFRKKVAKSGDPSDFRVEVPRILGGISMAGQRGSIEWTPWRECKFLWRINGLLDVIHYIDSSHGVTVSLANKAPEDL